MTATVTRTKDQLAVLLKLVEVNKVGLTRRNLSIRQRIWQVITQKLNEMQGAEKDVEGWKRSYNSWRLNVGDLYNQEKERILKNVADDDYFIINVTDDEVERQPIYEDGATYLDPKDLQLTCLHELVTAQRLLFINTSEEDEPLRQRLWQNIADQLNSIPGGTKLPKEEWQKHVDLSLYTVARGRKRKIVPKSKGRKKSTAKPSSPYKNVYDEYIIEDILATEHAQEREQQNITNTPNTATNKEVNDVFAEIDEIGDNTDDIINLLNEQNDANTVNDNFPFDIEEIDDDDYFDNTDTATETNGKTDSKKTKLTPIVKSFKYSSRITTAVEQLRDDVKETKDMLKQTTQLLNRMCGIMEERNKKQDETNAILKRNGQLLKILVEYKCGMRGKVKN